MPYCYYTCNLLPLDLVVRGGYSPRWLGNHLRDTAAPSRREALGVHPMTCPYVTKLVAAAESVLGDAPRAGTGDAPRPADSEQNCLVVPGGCDAMRRLGDLLADTYRGRVFVLPLPRSSGEEVIKTLAADLRLLEEWLRARFPDGAAAGEPDPSGAKSSAAGDPDAADGKGTALTSHPGTADVESPRLEYPSPPRPGGVFLVSGPLSDDSLLRLVENLGTHVSGLESCTSPDRWRPLATGTAAAANTAVADDRADSATTTPPNFEALAAQMLDLGMCPRRSTAARREYLARRFDETQPSSVIYARQSFCDPGAYDALLVAQMAEERDLPYLEIEVDFPLDAGGPLRTRVEAFLESQLLDEDLLVDLRSDNYFQVSDMRDNLLDDLGDIDVPDDDLFHEEN